MSNEKAHFGFQIVEKEEKQLKVQSLFSDVAFRYDLMNDIMSLNLHRLWKNKLISELSPYHDDILLDIAGGTGDIAERFIACGGKSAIICDLNAEMLKYGEDKRLDRNMHQLPIKTVCANAEELPFVDDLFDYCTISFGIRNVTNIDKALSEAYRVLKPGGRFLCLEFSHININILKQLYDLYSFNLIPKIGQIITGNGDHYRYLVESIKMFPTAEKFALMFEEAGFNNVKFQKLTFGVVAIHSGYKV